MSSPLPSREREQLYTAIVAENQRQGKMTMRDHMQEFGTDWQPVGNDALWRAIRALDDAAELETADE